MALDSKHLTCRAWKLRSGGCPNTSCPYAHHDTGLIAPALTSSSWSWGSYDRPPIAENWLDATFGGVPEPLVNPTTNVPFVCVNGSLPLGIVNVAGAIAPPTSSKTAEKEVLLSTDVKTEDPLLFVDIIGSSSNIPKGKGLEELSWFTQTVPEPRLKEAASQPKVSGSDPLHHDLVKGKENSSIPQSGATDACVTASNDLPTRALLRAREDSLQEPEEIPLELEQAEIDALGPRKSGANSMPLGPRKPSLLQVGGDPPVVTTFNIHKRSEGGSISKSRHNPHYGRLIKVEPDSAMDPNELFPLRVASTNISPAARKRNGSSYINPPRGRSGSPRWDRGPNFYPQDRYVDRYVPSPLVNVQGEQELSEQRLPKKAKQDHSETSVTTRSLHNIDLRLFNAKSAVEGDRYLLQKRLEIDPDFRHQRERNDIETLMNTLYLVENQMQQARNILGHITRNRPEV